MSEEYRAALSEAAKQQEVLAGKKTYQTIGEFEKEEEREAEVLRVEVKRLGELVKEFGEELVKERATVEMLRGILVEVLKR